MCNRCAFSDNNNPSKSIMCEICFRNPENASRPFTEKIVNGIKVSQPIDAYISKELYELLEQYFKAKQAQTAYRPWMTVGTWTWTDRSDMVATQ